VFSALVILAISGPGVILQDTDLVATQEMVDYINSSQDSWTASRNWVGDMTFGEARTKYASTLLKEREFPEHNWGALLDYMAVPTSFNAVTQWPKCVLPILNQAQCGSCWAFGATEALATRLCIATNGATFVTLSPQYLVNCDTANGNMGCNGGYPDYAWQFMKSNGVPTMTCVPYLGVDAACSKTCADKSAPQFYKASSVSTYSGPASIQAAILANGPIEVAFTVYQDFMTYSGGVYVHKTGGVVGGHAVMMVGWGVSGSQNYWICANSWTSSWGLQGYFWIAFGQCGIDSQGVAGLAAH